MRKRKLPDGIIRIDENPWREDGVVSRLLLAIPLFLNKKSKKRKRKEKPDNE